MKKNKFSKLIIIGASILLALLSIIGIFVLTTHYQTEKFNAQVFTSENGYNDVTFEYGVQPNSNGWDKLTDPTDDSTRYRAEVYDLKVTNNAIYSMPDWTLRIDVIDDSMLSKVWSGTMEVHQFIDGVEHIGYVDKSDNKPETLVLIENTDV